MIDHKHARLSFLQALLPGCLLAAVAIAAPAREPERAAPPIEVAAWAPSMVSAPYLENRSVRVVVHLSIGGSAVRLRFSNRYGLAPLSLGAVAVALRSEGGSAQPGTTQTVRFDGNAMVAIAPGKEMVSDPVDLDVAAGADLLVSFHLPERTMIGDLHPGAYETGYISRPGNHVADVDTRNYRLQRSAFYFLSGVSVESPRAHGTIVAFGDSITDGANSTPGANRRWPDLLAARLDAQAGGSRFGVVNAGIGGNRVLTSRFDGRGDAAVRRFAHDALGQPNVRAVIVLEGINDIAAGELDDGSAVTADKLIAGFHELIAQAHARRVKIIGTTILPWSNGSRTAERERIRSEVNAWIRDSGAFDAVFDFDAAIRDPADPTRMRAAFDSGDHLHPNDAGMQAIADSIDLELLQSLAAAVPAGGQGAE